MNKNDCLKEPFLQALDATLGHTACPQGGKGKQGTEIYVVEANISDTLWTESPPKC